MRKSGHPRTFWARVQLAMESRGGITQKRAAKLAGVEQPSVSLWNKPNGYPEIRRGVELAKEIGACVEWLYTERGPMRPGAPDDAYARELWTLWTRLDDVIKRDLVGFARVRARPTEEVPVSEPAPKTGNE